MSEQISFEAKGLSELSDRMRKSGTVLRININKSLIKIGRLFVPAKGSGPLAAATPRRTGALRRSTVFEIMGGPPNQILEIRQGARSPQGVFYGFLVREGTGPHVIEARNKKALKFIIGGEEIIRRRVQHPGTKPNPYHKRVMANLQGQVQNIVNEMGDKVIAFLSGR